MRRVILGGVEYPVAVTFGAITTYLESVGEDTAEGMASFSKLPPSRYPDFLAACVNEGLRKDGRDDRIKASDIADLDLFEVSAAIAVVFGEMVPKSTPDKKKE